MNSSVTSRRSADFPSLPISSYLRATERSPLSKAMDPLALPIDIRDAKPSELGALGKLHASAVANDNLWKTLWDKVDPEIRNEERDGVARGTDSVRVLERTDTSEAIGVIWFRIAIKHKHDKKESQRPRPAGFNHELSRTFMVPTSKFQEEILQMYGGYLCKSSTRLLLRNSPADKLALQMSRNLPSHRRASLKGTAGYSCRTSSRWRERRVWLSVSQPQKVRTPFLVQVLDPMLLVFLTTRFSSR